MAHDIYPAIVTRVMAGDDYVLLVNLKIENLHLQVRARLYGVDTPSNRADPESAKLREHVSRQILHRWVKIEKVHKVSKDNSLMDNWVVILWFRDVDGEIRRLNDVLRDLGYKFGTTEQQENKYVDYINSRGQINADSEKEI